MRQLLHVNLHGLALSKALASISLQLTNVFLALLILTNGLHIEHVCALYLVYSVARLAAWPAAIQTLARGKISAGFLVGYIARAVQALALSLYVGGGPTWSLIVLGAAFGVSSTFTITTEAYYVARHMDKPRKGKDISRLEIVAQAVGWVAPLAGGVLAAVRGQLWLGLAAAALSVLAVLPVYADKKLDDHYTTDTPAKIDQSFSWPSILASATFTFQGATGNWLWYVYVAAVIPSFHTIGGIATVAAIAAFSALELSGRLSDRYHWGVGVVLIAATAAMSLLSLARVGVVVSLPLVLTTASVIVLSVVTSASDMLTVLIMSALRTNLYAHIAHYGLGYLSRVEGAGCIAGVLFWGVVTLLAYADYGIGHILVVALAGMVIVVWGLPCIQLHRRTAAQ